MRQSAHCHFVNGGLCFSGTRFHLHVLFFLESKNFRNEKAMRRNIKKEIKKTKMVNGDIRKAYSPKEIASPLSLQIIAASRPMVFSNMNFLNASSGLFGPVP